VLTVEAILEATALELNIPMELLMGPGKHRLGSRGRRVAGLAMNREGYSFYEIGKVFGRDDATMRQHSWKATDDERAAAVDVLRRANCASFEIVEEQVTTAMWSIRNRSTGDGEFLPPDLAKQVFAFLEEKNLL